MVTPGEIIAARSKGEKGYTNQMLFNSVWDYFTSLGLKVKTLKVNFKNLGRRSKRLFILEVDEATPKEIDHACASLNLDIQKHMSKI